jgi:hypothetical protein
MFRPRLIVFKGLPCRLHPLGLKPSIILVILLLFVLLTCLSQFDLHLLSFSSAGSTFNSYKISPYLSGPKVCTNSITYSMLLRQSMHSVKSVANSRVEVLFFTYRLSREECKKLRESVPYVKLYRYNPKHLYPKFNGYGDNGQRSLKL